MAVTVAATPHTFTNGEKTMASVTFTHGTTTHKNPSGESQKIVTVFADGSYEDTMIMDASATDDDAMSLYRQRLIDAEETKLAWGW